MRAIDSDALKEYIKKTDLTAVERGALLQAISNMPTLTPPNEPLTWNELGNMIEKPVYIVELEDGESCWVLVHTVDDIKALFVSAFDQYDYGNRELYGQTWLAYRRPPEVSPCDANTPARSWNPSPRGPQSTLRRQA